MYIYNILYIIQIDFIYKTYNCIILGLVNKSI